MESKCLVLRRSARRSGRFTRAEAGVKGFIRMEECVVKCAIEANANGGKILQDFPLRQRRRDETKPTIRTDLVCSRAFTDRAEWINPNARNDSVIWIRSIGSMIGTRRWSSRTATAIVTASARGKVVD